MCFCCLCATALFISCTSVTIMNTKITARRWETSERPEWQLSASFDEWIETAVISVWGALDEERRQQASDQNQNVALICHPNLIFKVEMTGDSNLKCNLQSLYTANSVKLKTKSSEGFLTLLSLLFLNVHNLKLKLNQKYNTSKFNSCVDDPSSTV